MAQTNAIVYSATVDGRSNRDVLYGLHLEADGSNPTLRLTLRGPFDTGAPSGLERTHLVDIHVVRGDFFAMVDNLRAQLAAQT